MEYFQKDIEKMNEKQADADRERLTVQVKKTCERHAGLRKNAKTSEEGLKISGKLHCGRIH